MSFIEEIKTKAKSNIKTIILPEAEDERTLRAADAVLKEGFAKIVLLGDVDQMKKDAESLGLDISGATCIDPKTSDKLDEYVDRLYELRKEKGMTPEAAREALTTDCTTFGVMMLKQNEGDGLVSGACHSTANTLRPALQIIKSKNPAMGVSSFFIMVSNGEPFILSDCGLVIKPSEKELADIAVTSAMSAIMFGITPKVAMLSYSTKGSGKGEDVDKVKAALALALETLKTEPYNKLNIEIDGELQADAALDVTVASKKAPESKVAGHAKVLIVPDLNAGNISYKLLQRLGGCEAYGPVLQGLNAPINDLSRGALVEDILGTIAITAIQAQNK